MEDRIAEIPEVTEAVGTERTTRWPMEGPAH